jgi:hypothetical protein
LVDERRNTGLGEEALWFRPIAGGNVEHVVEVRSSPKETVQVSGVLYCLHMHGEGVCSLIEFGSHERSGELAGRPVEDCCSIRRGSRSMPFEVETYTSREIEARNYDELSGEGRYVLALLVKARLRSISLSHVPSLVESFRD